MRTRRFVQLLFLLGPMVLCSCSKKTDEMVFIPAESYACTVKIVVPAEATAGEWIPLKASRTSGPWRQVKRSEVSEGATFYLKSPPGVEDDVQANVHWQTDPPNVARFSLPNAAESALSGVRERQVVFPQPGVYKIWAANAYPTPATSNVETITIRPKK
ncbi:MAG: hypothetical protein LAO56_20835 [Acidobacteriia bacterium]|nr:hypothetical protein [Terriglobia bacterium]